MNISSSALNQYGYNRTTADTTITGNTPSSSTVGYETRLSSTEGAQVSSETLDTTPNFTTTMSVSDVIEDTKEATTNVPSEQKISIFTDMQLHFIIVGGLFLIVVILALINLYIHFRSQGRLHSFEKEEGRFAIKASSGGGGSANRRGGYTVKMKAKPSLFI